MSASSIETERKTWTDDFIGTREQLIEAGLARPGEFPGDPGRNKTVKSYRSDGTYKPHCRGSGIDDGGRRISLEGKSKFRVAVRLSREAGERRSEAECQPQCDGSWVGREVAELTRIYRTLDVVSRAHVFVFAADMLESTRQRQPPAAILSRRMPVGWHVIDGGRHA